ncbi:MAG: sugar phosphate nucleotidyltransferase [Actinomycetota bacterium]|nr:sugar phosphate nucleotidyltransferase [Actinomycetota bacterium]
MGDSLAALVLAAGQGTRLRPLTLVRPKPLCPVGGVALVDRALATVAAVVGDGAVAVNAHTGIALLEDHLAGRVFLSVEEPVALGTAGAVAHLRPWLDGRPVLVVNADTWHTVDLGPLVAGWDGEQVRVLVAGDPSAPLGPATRILGSLLPPSAVAALPSGVSGLSVVCWRPAAAAGTLETVGAEGTCIPCDRPCDYLAANLAASGGASVAGEGATVEGTLLRSVVWPGGVVRRGEALVDAIRVGEAMTVLVR